MRTDSTADRGLPFQDYELQRADFTVPDQNLRIYHRFKAEDPSEIGYVVLSNDGGGIVYDPRRQDATATWDRSSIVLRTSRAPSRVVLLLVHYRPESTR